MVLLLAGIIPFILSFYPPLKLYNNINALAKTILLILFIFGGWDIFATYRGHWSFNPETVSKIKIINLPLEEIMFFIVIPFSCIFTWEVIIFIKNKFK
ncbi:MAG: lycopene cyclase domain-containing protein [Candidatus Omnitrophica bacterium]|nr:lycopene cyclase domain-containing protein [Candidatus Omnitrophota bacterium]MCM8826281.1 lycopene cyclase domain-containing protein [Candidatus Omnitrophota bacterium]